MLLVICKLREEKKINVECYCFFGDYQPYKANGVVMVTKEKETDGEKNYHFPSE